MPTARQRLLCPGLRSRRQGKHSSLAGRSSCYSFCRSSSPCVSLVRCLPVHSTVLSLFLSLCVSHSVSPCPCISHCVSVSLRAGVSVSLRLCVSVSPRPRLFGSVSFSACLSGFAPMTYLPIHLFLSSVPPDITLLPMMFLIW